MFEYSDRPESYFTRLHRFLTTGHVFDVKYLIEAMRANFGDTTFQVLCIDVHIC